MIAVLREASSNKYNVLCSWISASVRVDLDALYFKSPALRANGCGAGKEGLYEKLLRYGVKEYTS